MHILAPFVLTLLRHNTKGVLFMKNKKLIAVLSCVLVVLIAAVAVVFITTRPETDDGKKEISVTVVLKDKSEKNFEITTDAEFLSQALFEEGLLKKSEYEKGDGLYTYFAGVRADYNADGAFWWMKFNGEDATVGIDSFAIKDGDEIEIIYTPA